MKALDLIRVLEGAGLEPRSYSGRGMNGAECVSVNVERVLPAIADVVAALEDEDCSGSDFADELRRARTDSMRTDSMGLDTVLYFPKCAWPECR